MNHSRFRIIKDQLRLLRLRIARVKDSPKSRELYALLIEKSDLPDPGRWRTSREIATSVRRGRSRRPEIRRASKLGSIAVMRALLNDADKRSITSGVLPLASELDAVAWLPRARKGVIHLPAYFKNVTDVGEGYVEGRQVNGLSNTLLYEKQFRIVNQQFWEKTIVGAVDNIVVTLYSASGTEDWPWEEVIPIAELLVSKVHRRPSTE